MPAGAFGVYAGEDTRESVGVGRTTSQHIGAFIHGSDPRMRVNVAGLAGGDGQVYDVPHIAGLRCDRVMPSRFAARCIQGIFWGLFRVGSKEETALVRRFLLRGRATFRVAPQRCPLSLPDRPKLVGCKMPHKVYRELQGEGKGEQHGTGLDTFPHPTLHRVIHRRNLMTWSGGSSTI